MKKYIRTKNGHIFESEYISVESLTWDGMKETNLTYLGVRDGVTYEIELDDVVQLYTKQGNDYCLVWDIERGVI